jgi:hypothetical protein
MKALCDIHEFELWTGAPLPPAGSQAMQIALISKATPTHRIARTLSADFTHQRCKIVPQARCLCRGYVAAQGLCRSSEKPVIAMNDVHAYTLP